MGNLKPEISDDFKQRCQYCRSSEKLLEFLVPCFQGSFVLDIIKNRYMLPFHHMPDSCYSESQQSSTVDSLRKQ